MGRRPRGDRTMVHLAVNRDAVPVKRLADQPMRRDHPTACRMRRDRIAQRRKGQVHLGAVLAAVVAPLV